MASIHIFKSKFAKALKKRVINSQDLAGGVKIIR
jgi:hypothetical protein